MKLTINKLFIILLTTFITQLSYAAKPNQFIIIDGKTLSIEQLVQIARHNVLVKIDNNAFKKVKRSHQLLLLAATKDLPVYGLNRGVGLNKDKTIFKGNVLTEEARKASEEFNMNDIYATSAGVGPTAPREVVRSAMATRLNTLLLGNAGVHPDVINMFVTFLNNDIMPIFPSGGSIGEADITLLAHIGLAMTGQGNVLYKGKIIPAQEALSDIHTAPLHLYAKDALSIFSSNAFTAGMAALSIHDTEKMIDKYELVAALSLEGINGNIAPFIASVQTIRRYSGQEIAASKILNYLQGSYVFDLSNKRALQDPLSFRTLSQVSGAARDALHDLKQQLTLQLNSSDDNPAVILDIKPNNDTFPQEKAYYVTNGKLSGAIIPTANFDPITWVLNIERLNIALAHLSASATQRIIKLGSLDINQLSRFLSPNQTTLAFSAIQKPIIYLNADIQHYSIPVSTITYPVAGDIEDTATNSLLVVEHLNKIVDDLNQIIGFELLHVSQAIDLRKLKNPKLKLGKSTQDLYSKFRRVVPFVQKDRELTPDIQKAYQFIIK